SVMDIGCHADYRGFDPSRRAEIDGKPLPDGTLVRPILRHALGNDGGSRRLGAIRLCECAAFEQTDSHGAKISWIDAADVGLQGMSRRLRGPPVDREGVVESAV